MTFLSRSQYEYGDPVAEQVDRAEQTDHYRATARGRRILLLADSLVDRLIGRGLLVPGAADARRELFHALADTLYGNAAIDLPDFTDEQSLNALRFGRPTGDTDVGPR
jgi:hypothetical protein